MSRAHGYGGWWLLQRTFSSWNVLAGSPASPPPLLPFAPARSRDPCFSNSVSTSLHPPAAHLPVCTHVSSLQKPVFLDPETTSQDFY